MKTLILSLLSLSLVAVGVCPAQDAGEPAKKEAPPEMTGLEVGTKAPDFTLKNQDGEDVSLERLLKSGPAAIVFYRSADW